MTTNEQLTEQFNTTLRDEPTLIIELSTELFNHRALIRLSKPGATSRSKTVQLVPVIVADKGVKHSAHLRMLADALESVGR